MEAFSISYRIDGALVCSTVAGGRRPQVPRPFSLLFVSVLFREPMQPLSTLLSAVRRRMWLRHVTHVASLALVPLLAATMLLVLVARWIPAPVPVWSFAVPPIAWIVAVAVAAGRRFGPADAAAAIDQYYAMKDRTASALQFATLPHPDPLQRLQVADTVLHLRKVRPGDCVPIDPSRAAVRTAATMALAIGLLVFYSQLDRDAVAVGASVKDGTAMALQDSLQAALDESLTQPLSDQQRQQLLELEERLNELSTQLQQASADPRQRLATLSEMQQAIEQAREQLAAAGHAEELQELAEAIEPANALQEAASALRDGQFEQAAEQLRDVDPERISDRQRRAVSDNLKKQIEDAGGKQPGDATQAAEQLQQALEQQDAAETQKALRQLADMAQRQATQQQVDQSMAAQLNQVAETKAQARGNQGGNQPGDSNQKSDRASQQWGRGTAGQPDQGEADPLDSQRQREQITGQQAATGGQRQRAGEDETQFEGTSSRQAYAQQYQEYRRQAEAVLQREPLPIGHRRTVRQYFDRLRPPPESREQP